MLMKKHVDSRAQPRVADSSVTRTSETKSKCMERAATSVCRKSWFAVSSSWQQPSLPLPWLCAQCQLLSQMGLCCFMSIRRDGSSAIPSPEDHGPPGSAERGPVWACRRGNQTHRPEPWGILWAGHPQPNAESKQLPTWDGKAREGILG